MEVDVTTEKTVRYHHYLFAQHVLLDYVLKRPKQSLEMFGTKDNEFFAIKHLKTIWYQIYAQFPVIEKVDFTGIFYSVIKFDALKTLVVVTLPKPQALTESYFVGIYYQHVDEHSEPEIRYFTLEYHDENESAVCELHQGQHTIYDLSDNLTNEEFRNKIMDLVK